MSNPEVDANGTKYWYNKNNQRHREDGPAIEWANSSKEWFLNGLSHRDDGPAADYADGTKVWYKHGLLHRDNGPAIEWLNGSKEWWLNGKKYTEDEFKLLQFAKGVECVYPSN